MLSSPRHPDQQLCGESNVSGANVSHTHSVPPPLPSAPSPPPLPHFIDNLLIFISTGWLARTHANANAIYIAARGRGPSLNCKSKCNCGASVCGHTHIGVLIDSDAGVIDIFKHTHTLTLEKPVCTRDTRGLSSDADAPAHSRLDRMRDTRAWLGRIV